MFIQFFKKIEGIQEEFELNLGEIRKGKFNHKPEKQKSVIKI